LKETTLLATQRKLHANKILLIGLGKKEPLTPKTLREVYSHISHTLSQLRIKDYAVEWFGTAGPAVDEAKVVEAVLAGLGTDPGRAIEATLWVPDDEKAQRIRQRIQGATGDA
jgi:leucyl aminopeptidase